MARLKANAIPTVEISLVAATAKTVLYVKAPANQRIVIRGWGVFFSGISGTAEPVLCFLRRASTDATVTSLTPTKDDPDIDQAIQSTAGYNASVEPTMSDVLDAANVHPQAGYEKIFPLGDEKIIEGGSRCVIVCTAPAGVDVLPKIFFEE